MQKARIDFRWRDSGSYHVFDLVPVLVNLYIFVKLQLVYGTRTGGPSRSEYVVVGFNNSSEMKNTSDAHHNIIINGRK